MTSPITRNHLERPFIPTLLRRPLLFPPRFWKPGLHRSVVKILLPRGVPAFVGRKRKGCVRSFRFEGRVYFTKMVILSSTKLNYYRATIKIVKIQSSPKTLKIVSAIRSTIVLKSKLAV